MLIGDADAMGRAADARESMLGAARLALDALGEVCGIDRKAALRMVEDRLAADTNDNGVTGIVALAVALRDHQSNELVLATVVPDEEIERDGQYEATMTFDRNLGSFPVSLELAREPLPRRGSGRE
jgi:hypothetical protein